MEIYPLTYSTKWFFSMTKSSVQASTSSNCYGGEAERALTWENPHNKYEIIQCKLELLLVATDDTVCCYSNAFAL